MKPTIVEDFSCLWLEKHLRWDGSRPVNAGMRSDDFPATWKLLQVHGAVAHHRFF
jgi:hypothetical protein